MVFGKGVHVMIEFTLFCCLNSRSPVPARLGFAAESAFSSAIAPDRKTIPASFHHAARRNARRGCSIISLFSAAMKRLTVITLFIWFISTASAQDSTVQLLQKLVDAPGPPGF